MKNKETLKYTFILLIILTSISLVMSTIVNLFNNCYLSGWEYSLSYIIVIFMFLSLLIISYLYYKKIKACNSYRNKMLICMIYQVIRDSNVYLSHDSKTVVDIYINNLYNYEVTNPLRLWNKDIFTKYIEVIGNEFFDIKNLYSYSLCFIVDLFSDYHGKYKIDESTDISKDLIDLYVYCANEIDKRLKTEFLTTAYKTIGSEETRDKINNCIYNMFILLE